jgi:hypothetical protein
VFAVRAEAGPQIAASKMTATVRCFVVMTLVLCCYPSPWDEMAGGAYKVEIDRHVAA